MRRGAIDGRIDTSMSALDAEQPSRDNALTRSKPLLGLDDSQMKGGGILA